MAIIPMEAMAATEATADMAMATVSTEITMAMKKTAKLKRLLTLTVILLMKTKDFGRNK